MLNVTENRTQLLEHAARENWDIIIIGGGITGAGILREASRRNLKAVLLEQKDFAWGTSSRSTKMVHGGLRYLKEWNLKLTRESVIERENLIRELPGLVENRSFVLPYYDDRLLRRVSLYVGLVIYDLLSGKWRKHVCSLKEMEKRAPLTLRNELRGGFLINDAVTDDARLVLRVLSEAQKRGAVALNYCRVDRLIREKSGIKGVEVTDTEHSETRTIRGRLVINATGAWADYLRKDVARANKKRIRPLRGSHLVLPLEKLPLVDNISLFHPKDGRPVTTLEWEGRVLFGTTDIDHREDLNSEASISPDEVRYLLDALNFQFPNQHLTPDDIISTQAGIRPVIDTGKENPSEESRDHVIWNEEGLLTVTGGKMTTFRIIAMDALKAAQAVLGPVREIEKKQNVLDEPIRTDYHHETLSPKTMRRLTGRYGNPVHELIAESDTPDLEIIPGTKTIWAELKWVSAREMVQHLDDLLLRRSRIGMLLKEGGKEQLPRIRKLCQPALGWDDATWLKEEKRYREIWEKHYFGVQTATS